MSDTPAPTSTEEGAATAIETSAGPAARFCRICGTGLVATASMCPSCGTAVYDNAKSKTAAVCLAVFLSLWTWVYTWKKDSAKFWWSLGAAIGMLVLGAATRSGVLYVVHWVFVSVIWLSAVILAATRPRAFYERYPDYEG